MNPNMMRSGLFCQQYCGGTGNGLRILGFLAEEPGNESVTVKTDLGHLGFAICYDMRFPELFRLMRLEATKFRKNLATFL